MLVNGAAHWSLPRYFVPWLAVPPLPNAFQTGELLLCMWPRVSSDHVALGPTLLPHWSTPKRNTGDGINLQTFRLCTLLFIKICSIHPLFSQSIVLGKSFSCIIPYMHFHPFSLSLPFSLTSLSVIRSPSASQHPQLFSPPYQLSTAPTFHDMTFFSILAVHFWTLNPQIDLLCVQNDLLFI